jgi:hypothetical protein
MIVTCACGRPLHYTDPEVRAAVDRLVADHGDCITITRLEDNRSWIVQRHYIALHGIKATDLGTERLPAFEEVTKK